MANTKTVEDKLERKKIKRAARKKAAPKARAYHPARFRQEEDQEAVPRSKQALSSSTWNLN